MEMSMSTNLNETKLKDLNGIIPYEVKKVIVWNANRDKAVIHNKRMFKISDSIYIGESEKENNYYSVCSIYLIYGNNLGFIISGASGDCTVEDIIKEAKRKNFDTLDGFMENIYKCIKDGIWINLVEMEFVKSIYPELVTDMENARAEHKRKLDEKRKQEKDERIAKQKAKMEKDNSNAMNIVNKAIQTIQTSGKIINDDFVFWSDIDNCKDYSTFTYLFDKYVINVPIKTRGFIINSLASVSVPVDINGKIEYSYFKASKNSKGSTKLLDLLHELVNKIRQEEK